MDRTVVGACPNDPVGVRCCTRPNCMWTSTRCGYAYLSGQCPGGSNYKLCPSCYWDPVFGYLCYARK